MLNDQVEEMKWQRRQQQQRRALLSSNCITPSIDDNDYSSDTERQWLHRGGGSHTPGSWSLIDRHSRDDDDDDEEATLKYPTPSTLSLLPTHDDRLSDSGSVDALDRPNPDTPEVFTGVPQTIAVARTSPPRNKWSGGRTLRDGQQVVLRSKETEQRSSPSDVDHKPPKSQTKTKEQEHSTNTDSFQDFCTYVEMLI